MDSKSIAENIARKLGLTPEKTHDMVASLTEIIADHCADMDSIAVPGFGTFEAKKRLERVSVHPATGKKMLIPPKMILTFRPSALMKQKCRNLPSGSKNS